MAQAQAPIFAELLKRYRVAANLTQDALAERAGLSTRAISDLERGVRRSPHRDTVALLADALGLGAEERTLLLRAAARPPRTVSAPSVPPALTATNVTASIPTESACDPLLPAPLTPIIGREREEAAAVHLLSQEQVRLLTLTGPPGIGKTRLAVQVATTLREQFRDGVCFVSLAAVREADLALSAVARALGLRLAGSVPLLDQLRSHLRAKYLLLLLDNFEQVVTAAPLLAELLASCPTVKTLVTSRAPLHVRGEHVLSVPPLQLPALDSMPPAPALGRYSAIALFVQRARAIRPTFALTAENAADVVAICHCLDGIPLAIELAAARVRLLPLPALQARLEHRLSALTGGVSDLPERQQTLRSAIGWSYELLDAESQRMFRRLSVFVGGCTLEAAAALGEPPVESMGSPHSMDILDTVETLVDQSLLVQEELPGAEARLTMLEMIREYGQEMLAVHGELAAIQRQHAEYFLAMAELAEPHLKGADQSVWLLRLEREHINLRTALAWACEAHETELGLRLAGALWWFWQLHGHLREGRQWLERLLEQDRLTIKVGETSGDAAGQVDRRALHARALEAVGNLASRQSDYPHALVRLEEGLALYRAQENRKGISDVLNVLGMMAEEQGEFDRAVALLEESLALRRALGAARGIGAVLNNLANVAYHRGEYARAVPLYEEAVGVFRRLEDRWAAAMTLNNLAESLHRVGDEQRAIALFGESLALFRQLGDKRGMGMALSNLGTMAGERAEFPRALVLFEEELYRGVGYHLGMIETIEELAYVCHKRGQCARAARLYGMAQAQRAAAGTPMPPNQRETNDQRGADLRAALGAETFAALATVGQSLTVDQVLAELKA